MKNNFYKNCFYKVRHYEGQWEVWEVTDDAWVKSFPSRPEAEHFIQQKSEA